MKNTELNLIPIFVAIFEERSISNAASRLGITQPAVSKSLKRLRETYNELLFHSTSKGIQPTTFASNIYPDLARSLSHFNCTIDASRNFNPEKSTKSFSIASISMANYIIFPDLLSKISQTAPNISVDIYPLFSEDHETDLRLQKYDLIVDHTLTSPTNFKKKEIFTDKLFVVGSKHHPRLADKKITGDEFLNEKHIEVSRWALGQNFFTDEFIPELEMRNITHRVANEIDMLPIINQTEMIGLVHQSTLQHAPNSLELKIIPPPFKIHSCGLSMIWHPNRDTDIAHHWLRKQIISTSSSIKPFKGK